MPMTDRRWLRGSNRQCPRCGCKKVAYQPTLVFKGHGPGIAACPNCEALWEPFLAEHIWDTSDPHCSFKEPCNNCAFRPGSPEQKNPEEWKLLLDKLKCGGQFFCHKGVPIDPTSKHGYAYRKKLRLCRGYLNALFALHRAYERERGIS